MKAWSKAVGAPGVPGAWRERALVAAVLFSVVCLTFWPATPVRANYRVKAGEETDYIQRTFYDAQAGLYHPAVPADPKALPYDFMWANGVQFSALVGAARHDSQRYRAALYAFAHGLERHWDKTATVPGFDAYFSSDNGDDKYYDDNAWLVLGFAEAYRDTHDAFFLDWARRTEHFVLSAWDDKLGGGLYWYQNRRTSKNTCVNAPAAAGALELYDIGREPSDLEWAQRLYRWTCVTLQDQDGLFWDNINLQGKVERMKWTYNTALMIRTNLGLWRVLKDDKYRQEARRLADAALHGWTDASTGAFADSARFNHLLSEALLLTYEATQDLKYLNAVRRNADFGYRYVRDAGNGGYWNEWRVKNHDKDERKTLIENASVARLFWLLADYPDVEELRARGEAAALHGDHKAAVDWLRQALDSTAGAPGGGT